MSGPAADPAGEDPGEDAADPAGEDPGEDPGEYQDAEERLPPWQHSLISAVAPALLVTRFSGTRAAKNIGTDQTQEIGYVQPFVYKLHFHPCDDSCDAVVVKINLPLTRGGGCWGSVFFVLL